MIHTDDGDLPAVIGSVPPHTETDDDDRTVHDVQVDPGLPAEDAADRITPGDRVSMDRTTGQVGEHVTDKSLDDRVCVFAMLEAARRIDEPAMTIHVAATVREEVGLRGAEAIGVDLGPDLALALYVTVADDLPDFDRDE